MADEPSTTDENGPEGPARVPFAAFLQRQENGGLHADLGDELARVVQAVRETGKAGTLTFVLKIKTTKQDNTLEVAADIKTKVPVLERGASYWYPDANGNLLKDDPRQMSFTTVREAPAPPSTVREAPAAPSTVREARA